MMAVRLLEMHRVLKEIGSVYLHCDPTASHYLKSIMDAIFGADAFRSEIIWKRSSAHSDARQGRRQHGRIHDTILFYTKSDRWIWNVTYTPYDTDYIDQFYRHIEPETGRRYRLGDLTGPGGAAKGNPQYEVMGVTRYWRYSEERMAELIAEGRVVQSRPGAVPAYKRYLDEMPGVPLQDIWVDIRPIGAHAKERVGYPNPKTARIAGTHHQGLQQRRRPGARSLLRLRDGLRRRGAPRTPLGRDRYLAQGGAAREPSSTGSAAAGHRPYVSSRLCDRSHGHPTADRYRGAPPLPQARTRAVWEAGRPLQRLPRWISPSACSRWITSCRGHAVARTTSTTCRCSARTATASRATASRPTSSPAWSSKARSSATAAV